MEHHPPGTAKPQLTRTSATTYTDDDIGLGQGSGNELVARRILKFLRQMNATIDDDEIRRQAIDNQWISEDGAPTSDGVRLIKGFDEIDQVKGA